MLFDRIVRWILPRQDHFFTLLEEIAVKMSAASAVFAELATASGHEQFVAISGRVKPIETEADHICHEMFEALNRTFVTPIDREDLTHLTGALDDVIDSMDHASAFATLFHFETLTEPMRQLIGITTRAVGQLALAVAKLRKFSDPESVREIVVAVHTLENEADLVYRQAIEALFAGQLDAIFHIRQFFAKRLDARKIARGPLHVIRQLRSV